MKIDHSGHIRESMGGASSTHQFPGEYIRQLRRQYNLTQTELGGERFSKSYVSAVERGKITPSHDALQFFAEQLGQSVNYFEQLFQQIESAPSAFSLTSPFLSTAGARDKQEKVFTLLTMLSENAELPSQQLLQKLPVLSFEELATLPLDKQARYSFYMGCIAQEKGDISTALRAFEYALALASPADQPSILDSLGVCRYLAHAYHIALDYHLRALRLLNEEIMSTASSTLRLRVQLHCAEDYRALGAHQQAVVHYERTRHYLNTVHDLKTAGQIHLGLGYCTYASLYQKKPISSSLTQTDIEEIEQAFQRAIGFLVQSRTLYQVSNDSAGELKVRLTQAMVLLDFCTRRRRVVQEKTGRSEAPLAPNCATLLGEAEEQCRQVLINGQGAYRPSDAPSIELQANLYLAMAYLIRIFVERATIARHDGHTDTAVRERARASSLCQRVLTTFAKQTLSWASIQEIVNMYMSGWEYQTASLPRPPDLSLPLDSSMMVSQAELYFAAGALAEELGYTATNPDFMDECYMRADQYFQGTLTLLHSALQEQQSDQRYLTCCYQRYIAILEERIAAYDAEHELQHMQTMLNILKGALLQLQLAPELLPLEG